MFKQSTKNKVEQTRNHLFENSKRLVALLAVFIFSVLALLPLYQATNCLKLKS